MRILVAFSDSLEELRRDFLGAPPEASLVELRLDRLKPEDLEPLMASPGKPRIATCRSRAQGGVFGGTEEERQGMLRLAVALGAEFVDLEFESDDETLLGQTGASRPILSYHHRGGTPLDLEAIYRRMAERAPGAILKLIPYADACSDNLRVRALLRQARAEERDLIAFCMGDRGQVSRILARAWGSWGVYAPARSEAATAPGQLLLSQLADLYREDLLQDGTPLTGVLGHPVSFSLSPLIYNRAYREMNMEGCFLPFDAEVVAEFLPLLSELPITGLAVTHPHKESLVPHCDELDASASDLGAVNTVVRRWNRLVGFNTDREGTLRALRPLMDLRGIRAGVLGAGGAAVAVGSALTQSGARVTLFSRDAARGTAAAARAGCAAESWGAAGRFRGDLLVNATPVGMGQSPGESPVAWDEIRAEVAFDLVMQPPLTEFLSCARRSGARILGGASLFLEQATLQFEILTGKPAPRALFEEILSPHFVGLPE